jgi:hypothetical protein
MFLAADGARSLLVLLDTIILVIVVRLVLALSWDSLISSSSKARLKPSIKQTTAVVVAIIIVALLLTFIQHPAFVISRLLVYKTTLTGTYVVVKTASFRFPSITDEDGPCLSLLSIIQTVVIAYYLEKH